MSFMSSKIKENIYCQLSQKIFLRTEKNILKEELYSLESLDFNSNIE